MDDPSDPQRHTSRTLYPDLPSAYAQIQGRRVASSQKTRSSGVETRFPLSPSSSSSEEAEDDLNPLTLGNDAIPLQDLPCRRVPSAMGILHEAEDHQESSAILESTHDTLDVDRAERQSLTLDEIVAQYADPTPAASPLAASHNNEAYGFSFLPRTQFLHRGQEEDNGCMENVAVGRLQNSREHLLIQKHASEVCSEQGNAPIVTSFDDPADSENEDEEWETPPDTSRRGFLNPSRSRFRLTKRDTGESSQLTVGVANTPATPWDPLSNTTEPPMYRHGFRRKDRSQYDQEHTSPTHRPSKIYPVNDNRILGAQGQRLGTVHEKQLHATEEVSRLNSARAPGPNTQTSQLGVRSSSPLSNSTQFALRDMSSNPPTLLSSRFTDKTLPSSSLLPRASDKALHRTPSSRTTMSSAGDDNIFQNQYVDSHSLESHTSTDKSHHEDNSNAPRLATITNRNETAVDGLIDTNGSKTQNTSLMSTTESSGQRSTSYNTQNARDPLEAQVRQIFVHGGYTTSDGDISRFLRDTRHRHEQNGSVQQEGTTNLGNTHAGIKTTGSSLANYSFVSLTSIGHQKLKCAEENKNSSKDESPAVADNGLWTSRKLLGTSEDAAENTSIRSASSHSSLLRPTGTSLARTSASLLSTHLNTGFTPPDVPIVLNGCPHFPLTSAQLSIIRLDGIDRVPFERLQVLENGDLLEKAWCFIHQRMEYSHAGLVRKEAAIGPGTLKAQRDAGRLLLVVSMATFFVGGFVLAHDMGRGGALSSGAMAELTGGVVSRVHPVDTQLARAIEKGGLLVVVCVLVGCVGVLASLAIM